MPGLGLEDAFIVHDEGMEAGVHIEIRQLQQLRLGQGSYGIVGTGIHGVGVQVGVIGLIDQVKEQRRGRILVRPEQGGVLEHMRQAGIVQRTGGEGDLEGAVGVLVRHPEHLAAGLLMLKQHQIRAHQREIAELFYFKAVHHVADLRQRVGFLGQRFSQARNAGQRQGQRKQKRQRFFHE